jgi:hypothetical protein
MMRLQRAILLSVLLLFGLSAVWAQEPPIPPRRGTAPKVGLFVGFTPAWLKVDVAPVNEFLAGTGAVPLKNNGIFMVGGAGSIYILVIKNFRVGGMGLSGSTSSSGIDAGGIRRDVQLAVGLGGLTFEYVVPIVRRLDFAFGSMVGWGSTTISLRQYAGGNHTWSDEQSLFGSWPPGSAISTERTLSGSFLALVPSVSFEYAVLGWLAFRLGASYNLMLAPSWSVDGEYDLSGVPSSVKGNGFMVNAGIFVGTF